MDLLQSEQGAVKPFVLPEMIQPVESKFRLPQIKPADRTPAVSGNELQPPRLVGGLSFGAEPDGRSISLREWE